MLIKTADDQSADIAILQAMRDRPDASTETKKKIEQEIRNMRAGMSGEREAAYEIDFHFGEAKNWAVLHDLRIEHHGRVAQIDHLVIGLDLRVWVCESKRFSEGISINEHGECAMFWRGKPQGIGSPYEQNARHIAVLESACDGGAVDLPVRLGWPRKPTFTGLVVVSKTARVARPKAAGWWTEGIVKTDTVKARIESYYSGANNYILRAAYLATRLISMSELESFAKSLSALHKPASYDWHSRFGMDKVLQPPPDSSPSSSKCSNQFPEDGQSAEEASQSTVAKRDSACATCGKPVSQKVATFCVSNSARFGGKIFCYGCQNKGALRNR